MNRTDDRDFSPDSPPPPSSHRCVAAMTAPPAPSACRDRRPDSICGDRATTAAAATTTGRQRRRRPATPALDEAPAGTEAGGAAAWTVTTDNCVDPDRANAPIEGAIKIGSSGAAVGRAAAEPSLR